MRAAIFLFLSLFLLSFHADAAVYRWVDPQGNVVYSDQPRPGAEEVLILNAPEPPPPPGEGERARREERQPVPRPKAKPYVALSILSPAAGETIQASSGNLPVVLEVAPPLQVEFGHRIRVFLDGEPRAEGGATQFTLADVLRGPHTVQAAVMDQEGRPLITSMPVQFHMLRPSALMQEQPGPYPSLPRVPYPTPGRQ